MNDPKMIARFLRDASPGAIVGLGYIEKAADAIEQLVKERDVLEFQNHLERCEHEHTKKERDAAVADLNAAKHCSTCKKRGLCAKGSWTDSSKCPFEWRGVQEVEHGNT